MRWPHLALTQVISPCIGPRWAVMRQCETFVSMPDEAPAPPKGLTRSGKVRRSLIAFPQLSDEHEAVGVG